MQPSEEFTARAEALEEAYLRSDDQHEQSGFSGGRDRWIAERRPLIEAVESDGTFLDVGCANGQLLVDVVDWASDKGIEINPYGLDLGPELVGLARDRFNGRDNQFWVGNAWGWRPPRRWTYVYSLLDLAPKDLWCVWLHKLSQWVEPGGKLVIGSYGSRSQGIKPVDVAAIMMDCGLEPLGSASGGVPAISRFAWCEPG